MKNIFNLLWSNYQIYTSLQVGSDTEISEILAARSMSLDLINENNEWGHKAALSHYSVNNILYQNEKELFDVLNYCTYDLAYIHYNNTDFNLARDILILLRNKRTRFIILHPKLVKVAGYSRGYLKQNLEKGYQLQYLDIIQEEYFNKKED